MAATFGSRIFAHASAVVTHPPEVRKLKASSRSASSAVASCRVSPARLARSSGKAAVKLDVAPDAPVASLKLLSSLPASASDDDSVAARSGSVLPRFSVVVLQPCHYYCDCMLNDA